MKRKIYVAVVLSVLIILTTGKVFAVISDEEVVSLKKQIAALTERVNQLEKTPPKIKEEAACPAVLSVKAVDKIAEKETVEVLNEYRTEVAADSGDVLDKLPGYLPNYITKGLEYHGYFRSGYGINSKGGKMEAFQAPDALAKYRLGNEQETYIETIFLNKNWNPDPEGVTLETQIRMSYKTQQNQSWDLTNEVVLREMFGRMGHFVKWDPDIKVWAGERFYRLPETEIDDFWFADMSGYGGGFEDINIGIGKFAIAYIGYSNNDINLSTSNAKLAKNNLHAMFYKVPVPFGEGTFWINGGYVNGATGTDSAGVNYKNPSVGGVDIGMVHYVPGEFNNNQLGLQFGCGANTSLSAGADFTSGYDARKSWRLRVTEMYNRQVTKELSLQAVGVYQVTNYGYATENMETWASAGIRPIYMLSKHFGVEVEPGMDYINNPRDGYDAFLYKLTAGIRITPGMIFNSRPAFRIFATYAKWTDGFVGNQLLGGPAFIADDNGMNFGIQCENWW